MTNYSNAASAPQLSRLAAPYPPYCHGHHDQQPSALPAGGTSIQPNTRARHGKQTLPQRTTTDALKPTLSLPPTLNNTNAPNVLHAVIIVCVSHRLHLAFASQLLPLHLAVVLVGSFTSLVPLPLLPLLPLAHAANIATATHASNIAHSIASTTYRTYPFQSHQPPPPPPPSANHPSNPHTAPSPSPHSPYQPTSAAAAAAAMLKDLLASMFHPSEITSMFKLKFGAYVKPIHSAPLAELAVTLNDRDFCYETLNKVSRSFAVVIQQLPVVLRDPVCIFYLALRGLDSVEDDMTYPVAEKIPLLCKFYTKLLIDGWCIEGVGDSDEYRILLKHFYKVITVFKGLDQRYQSVILDITRKMGEGMAQFADKTASIDSVTNYNLYCHYVAGVVGHGLSQLFSASTLEDNDLQLQERLSNSMGLFLQKTNIIRDYLEDLQAGRTWWPEEIWGQYADKLSFFAENPNSEVSLSALNHMVNDALSHVPDCLDYLSRLRNKQIFEFCAIPQTMAIATLTEVYNNPLVFQKNVKVRKGAAAKMMLESGTLIQVQNWFRCFVEELERKMPKSEGVLHREREDREERKEEVNGNGSGMRKRTAAVGSADSNGKEEKRGAPTDINDNLLTKSQRHTNGHSTTTTATTTTTTTAATTVSPTPSAPASATGAILHHHQSASSTLNSTTSRTQHLLTQIRQLTAPGTQAPRSISYINIVAWLLFLIASVYLFSRLRNGNSSDDHTGGSGSGLGLSGKGKHFVDGPGFGLMGSGMDVLAVLICFVSVGYLFGFFGIQYV